MCSLVLDWQGTLCGHPAIHHSHRQRAALAARRDDARGAHMHRYLWLARRRPQIALSIMASMLASQRPAAVRPCSSGSLQARPAAGLAARLPSRSQQPLQRNAPLLRPAGARSPSRSRPLTVAQAAPQQQPGAQDMVCVRSDVRAASMQSPPDCRARRQHCRPHRRRSRRPPAPAVVAAAAAQPEEQSGGMGRTLTLALLFGAWYLFNIQFNM